MLIRKQSLISGKYNSMELPVTEQQLSAWKSGTVIQDAMPQLSDYQREFLITGMDSEEQDLYFSGR